MNKKLQKNSCHKKERQTDKLTILSALQESVENSELDKFERFIEAEECCIYDSFEDLEYYYGQYHLETCSHPMRHVA